MSNNFSITRKIDKINEIIDYLIEIDEIRQHSSINNNLSEKKKKLLLKKIVYEYLIGNETNCYTLNEENIISFVLKTLDENRKIDITNVICSY